MAAYRKRVKRRTAIAESKTSGFLSLVDNEVELLLKATHVTAGLCVKRMALTHQGKDAKSLWWCLTLKLCSSTVPEQF